MTATLAEVLQSTVKPLNTGYRALCTRRNTLECQLCQPARRAEGRSGNPLEDVTETRQETARLACIRAFLLELPVNRFQCLFRFIRGLFYDVKFCRRLFIGFQRILHLLIHSGHLLKLGRVRAVHCGGSVLRHRITGALKPLQFFFCITDMNFKELPALGGFIYAELLHHIAPFIQFEKGLFRFFNLAFQLGKFRRFKGMPTHLIHLSLECS